MKLHALAASTAFAILAGSLAGSATAQSLSAEPGKWENKTTLTGTIESPQMSMKLPGRTVSNTQCITEEDASFSPDDIAQDGCTVSNVKQDGRTMSYDMSCSEGGGSMTGSMEATVSEDGKSVTGTMTMQGSQPGAGKIDMAGDFSGKWTGACS